jgi:pimeloyl-ACP methyl ester carboxylesterase
VAHHTWTQGFTDETFTAADGGQLRAFVRPGEPGVKPVLLLHGLAQSRYFWGPVVRQLPQHWPVAVLDQRGHGDSDIAITQPLEFRTVGDDAGIVMDALDWHDTVVVGHSWGGGVAMTTTALHPERVDSVIAIDGGLAALQDLGDRDEVRRMLTPPNKGWNAKTLPRLFRRSPIGPWLTDDVVAALMAAYRVDEHGRAWSRLGFDRHMQVLEGMLNEHPEEYLAHIKVPAWVVLAEPARTSGDSYATNAWVESRNLAFERALEYLEQPRVVRISGALHDVPLQYPSLVAGVITSAHDEAVLATTPRKDGDA